jgi:DNA-binding YbaB/EbfC family protein
MGSGFSKMKKQAKLFEAQYEKMQEEARQLQVTGSAGNGLVTLVLNGEHQMKEIKIKPECIDSSDPEGLQDLIVAAHNDAVKKIAAQSPQGAGGLPF